MSRKPKSFLINFKTKLNEIDYNDYEEFIFSEDLQMNVLKKNQNEIYWQQARSKKPYTSCCTSGHTLKGGYTPSGKYKPAKYVPSKTDKRAGK